MSHNYPLIPIYNTQSTPHPHSLSVVNNDTENEINMCLNMCEELPAKDSVLETSLKFHPEGEGYKTMLENLRKDGHVK